MGLADFMFTDRQQRMLGPLLLNPGQSYGTLELIRRSGAGIGAGQNQLRKLEHAGVIKTFMIGNQRRIEIDPAFPLYPELRAICLKSFGLAEALRQGLAPLRAQIEQAFIFGSLAEGTDRADSDIDLMIIGTASLLELNEQLDRLEQQLSRLIHLNTHRPEEWATLQTDPVIQPILSGPRIPLWP